MSLTIFNEKVTENNYGDLIERLVNVFRISSFDKYILLALKIKKDVCSIDLSILNNDGNNEKYDSVFVDVNSSYFHKFLKELVLTLRENCEVTKEDHVNLDDDNFVAFRMITKFNDMITIDGLSENELKVLNEKEEPVITEDKVMDIDNKGSSTLTGLIFMIALLVVSFIAVVVLVD